MKFKTFFTSVAVTTMMAVAPTALSQTPNGGGATVRYQVFEAVGDMLFRVMDAKFCEQYGLECKPVRIGAGPAGIQAVIGNSMEVAVITTDAAIRSISGGAPVTIAHGLGDRVPFYFVARSGLDRPNKDNGYPALMQDFKGKRIGVTGRGAGTELIARLLLKEAGMSADDVTFVGVGGPPTAFGSLSAQQIDAAMQVPPTAEICDRSEVCETVLNLPESDIEPIKALEGTGIVALMKQEYVENNPQVVEAWLAAAEDAMAWMKDPANFDEYVALGREHIRLNLENADEILEEALARHLEISALEVSPSAVQAYVDMLAEGDLLPKASPAERFISDVAPLR
ncbi:ABC transporter substrate-binding protein [Halomonas ramblicola]|uniref:ABC transporter substrate-binding protein n=1 Tax=Halomonas ramblicola TaxID=747349 RepID=UPI0025B2F86D|nr:ABC transporter substrate-binding protein [Halomonas ramblicola]MDN3521995.1 ABC transporter substrate-binding protein [Halomonas ramblicola]